MAIMSIIGAVIIVTADRAFEPQITQYLPVSDDVPGTRDLMSMIAGSMIGISATSFSITLVAMTLASQQFGPRLLDNFMRDRGNQIVLGTFIATALYCITVLWAVTDEEGAEFVPQMAVTIGVILCGISLGVLIYFIHHVAESIRSSRIVHTVEADMRHTINRLFPETAGRSIADAHASAQMPDNYTEKSATIALSQSGYLQNVDMSRLIAIAREDDLIIEVMFSPGEFVTAGDTVLRVFPNFKLTDKLADRLRTLIITGKERTIEQDVEFLFNKLVEMGIRALSPGINDPYTAMMCLDHLGAGLRLLARRDLPERWRYDESGHLRIIAPEMSFETVCDLAFDHIRHYAAQDLKILDHMLKVIGIVGEQVKEDDYRSVLTQHAHLTYAHIRSIDPHQWRIQDDVHERYRQVMAVLSGEQQDMH